MLIRWYIIWAALGFLPVASWWNFRWRQRKRFDHMQTMCVWSQNHDLLYSPSKIGIKRERDGYITLDEWRSVWVLLTLWHTTPKTKLYVFLFLYVLMFWYFWCSDSFCCSSWFIMCCFMTGYLRCVVCGRRYLTFPHCGHK